MKHFILLMTFILLTQKVYSGEYSAIIHHANTQLNDNVYALNAEIEFGLSPRSKLALQKGISLTWKVLIKVQQLGYIWDSTLTTLEMSYQIQNHALLNLYSIKRVNDGSIAMFSTLTAALNSISNINGLTIINKKSIDPDDSYQIAIKVIFDREALPIPLRPLSYFKSDWALSSPWSIWQLQN